MPTGTDVIPLGGHDLSLPGCDEPVVRPACSRSSCAIAVRVRDSMAARFDACFGRPPRRVRSGCSSQPCAG